MIVDICNSTPANLLKLLSNVFFIYIGVTADCEYRMGEDHCRNTCTTEVLLLETRPHSRRNLRTFLMLNVNKSSAVAEMGDRAHNRHGPK